MRALKMEGKNLEKVKKKIEFFRISKVSLVNCTQ